MRDTSPPEPLKILCSVRARAYGDEWGNQGEKLVECRWLDVIPGIGEIVLDQGSHCEVEYTRIK